MPRAKAAQHKSLNQTAQKTNSHGFKSRDIIIPILGPTGSGKSTFINNLLRKNEATISDGLTSCTQKIQEYYTEVPSEFPILKNRRLVFVDTPGFGDTCMDESTVLKQIANWLVSSYHSNTKVGGIIYLYNIASPRYTFNDGFHQEIFEKICGESSFSKVILGTTRWNLCETLMGEKRERELRSKFWNPMLDLGSEMKRVADDSTSAWSIVKDILERISSEPSQKLIRRYSALQLQDEMVNQKLSIEETQAGQLVATNQSLSNSIKRFFYKLKQVFTFQ